MLVALYSLPTKLIFQAVRHVFKKCEMLSLADDFVFATFEDTNKFALMKRYNFTLAPCSLQDGGHVASAGKAYLIKQCPRSVQDAL